MSTSNNASAFAWGAADAAGSVISSTADMATVLALLLGVDGSAQGVESTSSSHPAYSHHAARSSHGTPVEEETNDSRRHRSTSTTTAAQTPSHPLSRTAWFDPTVVAGMLSGQMTVSWDWVKGCGLQPGGGNAPTLSSKETMSKGQTSPMGQTVSKGQTVSGGQTILGGQTTAGHAVAAGLGFDLVGDILLAGRRHPYVLGGERMVAAMG